MPSAASRGSIRRFARGWLAPDYDRFGFALLLARRGVRARPRMQWSYASARGKPRHGRVATNLRDYEPRPPVSALRPLLARADWAVSARSLSRDATGLRPQDFALSACSAASRPLPFELNSRARMRLALFDLDNTLLAGDSDYEWGQFLVDRGVLDARAYEAQNRAYYEQYRPARSTSTSSSASRCGRSPRTRRGPGRWHGDSWRAHPADDRRAGARAGARHLDGGDLCAIITATNSFVTAPIAREFGVEHLIATEPERATAASPARSRASPASARARSAPRRSGSAARHALADFAKRPSTATRTTTCRCSSA
jgi:hypothetical protein